MTNTTKFTSFSQFYPHYLTEHANLTCRRLHFIGTTLVIGLLVVGVVIGNWKFIAAMPIAGYGFAWAGHFFFEKNRPATFQYPFYSLASDFVMYWHMITFQLNAKMEKAKNIDN